MTPWLRLLSVILIALLAMGPGYATAASPECPMAHHSGKALEVLCKAQCQMVVALTEPALSSPAPIPARPAPLRVLGLVPAFILPPPAPPPKA